MAKQKLAVRERELRAELRKLVMGGEWIRGTVSIRERTCGKANCVCARGEKHRSMYLVSSKEGETAQHYIPRGKQPQVARSVQKYKRIKKLLERISELNLRRIG